MAFDQLWEQTHQTKLWGQYPNEQLTFFMRRISPTTKEERKSFQVLDVGCGQGANAWFLAREGYAVTALDCSSSALFRLYNRLKDEKLGAQLVREDLHEPLKFPDGGFDAIVDVQSVCYGTRDQVSFAFGELTRVLKPGGSIFSMMPADGCDNEHFVTHGACHFAKHDDIVEWFGNDMYNGYSCMRTVCIDYHKNQELKPFLVFWMVEARKKSV